MAAKKIRETIEGKNILSKPFGQSERTENYVQIEMYPAHPSVSLDQDRQLKVQYNLYHDQMIFDHTIMQERIDLIKSRNFETGLEENHLSFLRAIGDRSVVIKISCVREDYEDDEEIGFMENMPENFQTEWEQNWNLGPRRRVVLSSEFLDRFFTMFHGMEIMDPAHLSILLDQDGQLKVQYNLYHDQMIFDQTIMQERIDMIKTRNFETGLEENHLSAMRAIGDRSVVIKDGHLEKSDYIVHWHGAAQLDGAPLGGMNDEMPEDFFHEWEEKWTLATRLKETSLSKEFLTRFFEMFA